MQLDKSININFIKSTAKTLFGQLNESNIKKTLSMMSINENCDVIAGQCLGASPTYSYCGINFTKEQVDACKTLDIDARKKYLSAFGLTQLDAESAAENLALLGLNESKTNYWDDATIEKRIAILEDLGYDKVSQMQYLEFSKLPKPMQQAIMQINESSLYNDRPLVNKNARYFTNPFLNHKIEQEKWVKDVNMFPAFTFNKMFNNAAVNATINGVDTLVYVDESYNVGFAKPVNTFISENGKIESEEQFREYAKNVLKEAHADKYDDKIAAKTINALISKYKDNYGAMVGALTSGFGLNESVDANEMFVVAEIATALKQNVLINKKISIKHISDALAFLSNYVKQHGADGINFFSK